MKKEALLENIHQLRRTGFLPVFLSNVLAKACALLGSIVVVRILSKADYGLYTGIMNSYSMLFILNDLGCNVAMMQYRSENFKDKRLSDAYFSEPLKFGIAFSLFEALLILASPLFYPFKQAEIARMTQQLFLLPLLSTLNGFVISNLRVLTENKKFAVVNFSQTFFHYLFLILSAVLLGVRGAVWSNYLIQGATLVTGVLLSKGLLRIDFSSRVLDTRQKKDFLKYAFASQINNSIGVLLTLFDVFLIGIFIVNNEVLSSYKVASTIPQALMFIPNSILVYATPYFARNLKDLRWVRGNTKKLLLGCALVNGMIAVLGILTADFLLPLIFGAAYADSVKIYKILLLSFFFTGSFQIPSANIIYTQHRVRINILITIISNVANCILDVILIRYAGSLGAAYATCLVSMIASVTALSCLWAVVFRRREQEKRSEEA